jgi:poly(3-hydroxybutyrate) depolymerase
MPLLALLLALLPRLHALEPGKGRFDHFVGERRVRVWTYVPQGADESSPVVVVLHGVLRNGKDYRKSWIGLADERKFMVLVPEFSRRHWPEQRSYGYGNVLDAEGRPVPDAEWAYTAVDDVFERFRAENGLKAERYSLFGHSAGAQFVHRMVLQRPRARFDLAVAANAGWYVGLDGAQGWPTGLKGTPADAERVRAAFGRGLVLLLGEADTDPEDEYLPRGEGADEQGPNRLVRGHTYFRAALRHAERLGAPFAWRLETVPGVGHDQEKMAPAAADLILRTLAARAR